MSVVLNERNGCIWRLDVGLVQMVETDVSFEGR